MIDRDLLRSVRQPQDVAILRVNAERTERIRAQKYSVDRVRQLLSERGEIWKNNADVEFMLTDGTGKWNDKRELGHLQRCFFSGDRALEDFGLSVLLRLRYEESMKPEARKVMFGESCDSMMAWTIGPLLMAQGVSLDGVLDWVATGRTQPNLADQINLRGLDRYEIRNCFSFSDYYDGLLNKARPHEPLKQSVNYKAAEMIARDLIGEGYVR